MRTLEDVLSTYKKKQFPEEEFGELGSKRGTFWDIGGVATLILKENYKQIVHCI